MQHTYSINIIFIRDVKQRDEDLNLIMESPADPTNALIHLQC